MKIYVGQNRAYRQAMARSKTGRQDVEAAGRVSKLAREGLDAARRGSKKALDVVVDKAGKVKDAVKEGVQKRMKNGAKPTGTDIVPFKPKGTALVPFKGKPSAIKRGIEGLSGAARALKGRIDAALKLTGEKALSALIKIGQELEKYPPTGVFAFSYVAGSYLGATFLLGRLNKRIEYLKKNGNKPPAPYVNPSAYLADAYPALAMSRKLNMQTLETAFKSKQFKQIESVLSKEQAEALKERLQKRVQRAPDRNMSVADTFAVMETIKSMSKKENLPTANIDQIISEGFAKANEQIGSWGRTLDKNLDS